MRYIYGVLLMALLIGCQEEQAKEKLDGKVLIKQKCAECHNLDMPPKSYKNEIAPSMMAVTFHLKDFIKSNDPSAHEAKIVAFVKDYVIEPSRAKSFCDKDSLDSYGLMPSQKGKVSKNQLEAIAHYMYKTYDNMKMLKIMAEKQRLESLSLHERILEKQRCNNCHDIEKDKVAPSFKMIASRYSQKDKEILIKSIKDGTKGKWEGKTLPMLAYGEKINDKDIEGMVDWILSLKP